MTQFAIIADTSGFPVALFEIVRSTTMRHYGNLVDRLDTRETSWWHMAGFVKSQRPDRSYVSKAIVYKLIDGRDKWEMAKVPMSAVRRHRENKLKVYGERLHMAKKAHVEDRNAAMRFAVQDVGKWFDD
jgi:hypothetical protein